MLMGVSTLVCTYRVCACTIYTRGFLHVISIKQVFSGPQEADLLTEVRVFCVPICDVYIHTQTGIVDKCLRKLLFTRVPIAKTVAPDTYQGEKYE